MKWIFYLLSMIICVAIVIMMKNVFRLQDSFTRFIYKIHLQDSFTRLIYKIHLQDSFTRFKLVICYKIRDKKCKIVIKNKKNINFFVKSWYFKIFCEILRDFADNPLHFGPITPSNPDILVLAQLFSVILAPQPSSRE